MLNWTREEKFHIYKQPCIIFLSYKRDIFHVRCYGFSQGRKSLSNTAVYVFLCCCLILENGEAIYKVFHYF